MNRSLLNQRYIPLRKLAAGGMGEIYLARQTGVAGFQRQVVLKRVHRRLSDNPRAVEMFLGEARLAALLNHPNIAQILDVGEEDGAYFIVMERIVGGSVRELAERATRQGRMIPMELSVTIIAQVLEGLRYAHGFRDESGQPLKIVHRDIGPTNILVSHDGAVKIVDFGIARAENQVLQEDGIAPGKFAYMAPEAILGAAVDARSDLFSVGVLLYELTVGQRLFRAASFEGMRRVVNDPIPPPTFARAGYPVDLEILVMRALERNPADRFESAEEMLEELEQFAFDTGLRVSRLRLGRFVSTTMGTSRSVLVAQDEGLVTAASGEPAPEDLDFDKGLFGGGELDHRPPAPAPRQGSAAEAIKRASAAIEELAADDDEEGATVEIRPAQQAQLRAHTVPAEGPVEPPAVEAPREGSALIVTDDLVEEVTDLADEEPEILVEPPRPRSDQEVTRRQRRRSASGGDASDDLKRALEDISKDLEAAAESDRERGERIGALVGRGQQPAPPAGPNRAASLPSVRDDDLERVDREGARPLDELEQSDIGAGPSSPEPEEEDSSILEPADAPDDVLAGDLEETDDGLDDHTIDLDLEGSDSVVVVQEEGAAGDGLDDPTLPEAEDNKQPTSGGTGKKKRRRRKRRKS